MWHNILLAMVAITLLLNTLTIGIFYISMYDIKENIRKCNRKSRSNIRN